MALSQIEMNEMKLPIGNNNGTQTPKIIKRIDTNKNDIK
jgi:hypothetical protein